MSFRVSIALACFMFAPVLTVLAPLPVLEAQEPTAASPDETPLNGLLKKADPRADIDVRISALEQAISVAKGLAEWHEQVPRDKWIAHIEAGLGKAYLSKHGADRDVSVEKALEALEAALPHLDPNADWATWVETQYNIGRAYINRVQGINQDNLDSARAALEPLLTVVNEQKDPNFWAVIRTSLGYVYSQRTRGGDAENNRLAIGFLEDAGRVLSPDNLPEAWATNESNLAKAYADSTSGKRIDNLRRSVEANKAALTIFTKDKYLQQWSTNEGDLGKSLLQLALLYDLGKTQAEISQPILEQAIKALQSALEVTRSNENHIEWASLQAALADARYTAVINGQTGLASDAISDSKRSIAGTDRDADPMRWAEAQVHLGQLYIIRHKREPDVANLGESVDEAIRAFRAAEEVFNARNHPEVFAQIEAYLGEAYNDRTSGPRRDNMELALTALTTATTSQLREHEPQTWAEAERGLAQLYRDREFGQRADNLDKAISAVLRAQEVITRGQQPEDWASLSLLRAASLLDHPKHRAESIERAIQIIDESSDLLPRTKRPEEWAFGRILTGNAFHDRYIGPKVENLEKSISAYQEVITDLQRERSPRLWAQAKIGERRDGFVRTCA
jgi:tetratricopeptide (TPR) repeat protein